jgi:dihydropteroate synthase
MVDTGKNIATMTIGGHGFQWGARTYVMGIVNVTTDSFSGDGLSTDVDAAVAQALAFQDAGADIIDVGGESSRPPGTAYGQGAELVSADEELSRVIPVIERLRDALDVPISIDTYKADVARQAVAAGAGLINDVWGLQRDPELARVAAETGVPIVLMHNQAGTEYTELMTDVLDSMRSSVDVARRAGVAEEAIIIDPGIGFGKTVQHNLELLRRLREFKDALGYPVLMGVSRKSTIGTVLGGLPPDDRLEGTAAAVSMSIANGADIVRVHDVKAVVRVVRMTDAIVRGWTSPAS